MSRAEPVLPFPLQARGAGSERSEEYLIPEADRAAVLEQMYPFQGTPGLDEERVDIHVDKRFKVRDFKVVREAGINYLVSPYYYEGGGTVADWFPVDAERNL